MTTNELRSELKPLLREQRFIMNKKYRLRLQELGFIPLQGRKHIILTFKGKKHEYKFPVSLTSSDKRAGLNLISDIVNRIEKDEGELWT